MSKSAITTKSNRRHFLALGASALSLSTIVVDAELDSVGAKVDLLGSIAVHSDNSNELE